MAHRTIAGITGANSSGMGGGGYKGNMGGRSNFNPLDDDDDGAVQGPAYSTDEYLGGGDYDGGVETRIEFAERQIQYGDNAEQYSSQQYGQQYGSSDHDHLGMQYGQGSQDPNRLREIHGLPDVISSGSSNQRNMQKQKKGGSQLGRGIARTLPQHGITTYIDNLSSPGPPEYSNSQQNQNLSNTNNVHVQSEEQQRFQSSIVHRVQPGSLIDDYGSQQSQQQFLNAQKSENMRINEKYTSQNLTEDEDNQNEPVSLLKTDSTTGLPIDPISGQVQRETANQIVNTQEISNENLSRSQSNDNSASFQIARERSVTTNIGPNGQTDHQKFRQAPKTEAMAAINNIIFTSNAEQQTKMKKKSDSWSTDSRKQKTGYDVYYPEQSQDKEYFASSMVSSGIEGSQVIEQQQQNVQNGQGEQDGNIQQASSSSGQQSQSQTKTAIPKLKPKQTQRTKGLITTDHFTDFRSFQNADELNPDDMRNSMIDGGGKTEISNPLQGNNGGMGLAGPKTLPQLNMVTQNLVNDQELDQSSSSSSSSQYMGGKGKKKGGQQQQSGKRPGPGTTVTINDKDSDASKSGFGDNSPKVIGAGPGGDRTHHHMKYDEQQDVGGIKSEERYKARQIIHAQKHAVLVASLGQQNGDDNNDNTGPGTNTAAGNGISPLTNSGDQFSSNINITATGRKDVRLLGKKEQLNSNLKINQDSRQGPGIAGDPDGTASQDDPDGDKVIETYFHGNKSNQLSRRHRSGHRFHFLSLYSNVKDGMSNFAKDPMSIVRKGTSGADDAGGEGQGNGTSGGGDGSQKTKYGNTKSTYLSRKGSQLSLSGDRNSPDCWSEFKTWFFTFTMGSHGIGCYHARDISLTQIALQNGYRDWFADIHPKEQARLLRDHFDQHSAFFLAPDSQFLTYWGIVMVVSLFYIALITPYELSFVLTGQRCDIRSFYFIANRLTDMLFTVDFIASFFTAIEIKTPLGTRLIKTRSVIAWRYVKSWFVFDLLATIPWDLLDCFVLQGYSQLKAMRLFRLFRLARLRKLEAMLTKWKDRLAIDFATRTLLRFVLWTMLLAHWMACLWGYTGLSTGKATRCFIEDGEVVNEPQSLDYVYNDEQNNPVSPGPVIDGLNPFDKPEVTNPQGYRNNDVDWTGISWIRIHFKSSDEVEGSPCDLAELYLWSLHWSIMTITSIGYGDIVPVNGTELKVCIIIMILSSTTWAYVVGKACTVVMQMNPSRQEFESHMDQLNSSMAEQGIIGSLRDKLRQKYFNSLPQGIIGSLRDKLRDYMREVKSLQHLQKSRDLARKLSPKLRMDFLMHRSQRWIGKLSFLEGLNKAFIISLIETFDSRMYARSEEISQNVVKLSIVENGTVGRGGSIYLPGDLWGEDVCLYNRCLQIRAYSIALNFVQLFTLSGAQLEGLFNMFPSDRRRVRRYAVILAFRRAAYLLGKGLISMEKIQEIRYSSHFDRTNKKKRVFRSNSFREPFNAQQTLMQVAETNAAPSDPAAVAQSVKLSDIALNVNQNNQSQQLGGPGSGQQQQYQSGQLSGIIGQGSGPGGPTIPSTIRASRSSITLGKLSQGLGLSSKNKEINSGKQSGNSYDITFNQNQDSQVNSLPAATPTVTRQHTMPSTFKGLSGRLTGASRSSSQAAAPGPESQSTNLRQGQPTSGANRSIGIDIPETGSNLDQEGETTPRRQRTNDISQQGIINQSQSFSTTVPKSKSSRSLGAMLFGKKPNNKKLNKQSDTTVPVVPEGQTSPKAAATSTQQQPSSSSQSQSDSDALAVNMVSNKLKPNSINRNQIYTGTSSIKEKADCDSNNSKAEILEETAITETEDEISMVKNGQKVKVKMVPVIASTNDGGKHSDDDGEDEDIKKQVDQLNDFANYSHINPQVRVKVPKHNHQNLQFNKNLGNFNSTGNVRVPWATDNGKLKESNSHNQARPSPDDLINSNNSSNQNRSLDSQIQIQNQKIYSNNKDNNNKHYIDPYQDPPLVRQTQVTQSQSQQSHSAHKASLMSYLSSSLGFGNSNTGNTNGGTGV